MIAASEPQEFVPCGRQHLKRHPGDTNLPSTQPQLQPESFLLHRLSQFSINDDFETGEQWQIRPSPDKETTSEEELYFKHKTAVWSRGSASTSQCVSRRVVVCSYTCETHIDHALWCTFHTQTSTKAVFDFDPDITPRTFSDEPQGTPIPCICLVNTENIKIFSSEGEDFITALQFEVRNVWPTKYGLLLERTNAVPSKSNVSNMSGNMSIGIPQLPTMFSLLHPLDEISPLLAKKGSVCYMSDPKLRVVFTSEDPSIAVLYDSSTGLHSVWKIRKATIEECQAMMCSSTEPSAGSCTVQSTLAATTNSSSMPTSSGISTKDTRSASISDGNLGVPSASSSGFNISTSIAAHSSMRTSAKGLSRSLHKSRRGSDLESLKGSPISRRRSSVHSPRQRHNSSAHSPQLMTSLLTRHSPLPSAHKWTSSQLHLLRHSISAPGRSPSVEGSPPMEARMLTSQCVSYEVEPKPIFPELCLEHLWTENLNVPREGSAGGPATRVFLSTDLVGQQYLCYLVPSSAKLYCARLEKSNKEQQLIFGVVTTVVAKDAAPLLDLGMIATVDKSGCIVLYSGLTLVGKVHVAGISSALTTSSYLSLNLGSQFGTPFPRRSSMVPTSASRPTSAMETAASKIDEEVYLLSPVSNSMNYSVSNDHSSYVSTPRAGKLSALRDSVGNRVTLEYTDGSLYRISLPKVCSSQLVSRCLLTLKTVLKRDLAMQVTVKWYGMRNAPGTQDISPEHEWQLFMSLLLELFGYCVEKLHILTGFESGPTGPALRKKKRVSECGSEQDWEYLLRSAQHQSMGQSLSEMLGLPLVRAQPQPQPSPKSESAQINCSALLFTSLPLVLFSLHLLYEELKLTLLLSESMPLLAQLLSQLSRDLQLHEYADIYWRDFPTHCPLNATQGTQISDAVLKKLRPPSFMRPNPPNIFAHLFAIIVKAPVVYFPYIGRVNPNCRNVVQLVALITYAGEEKVQCSTFVKEAVPVGSQPEATKTLSRPDVGPSASYPMPERAVLLMTEMGITRRTVKEMPAGIALLLNTVLYRCRDSPPVDWPEAAYKLIYRQDLASQCRQTKTSAATGDCRTASNSLNSTMPHNSAPGNSENRKTAAAPRVSECDQDDGMEAMDMELLKLRFSKDHRVAEVRRLLQSSQPVTVAIYQRPEVSDHEFIEEQEKHLYAMCTRTMALPLGRGMFTLRTAAPVITETLPIPRLCLTGKVPPRGTTVDLTHIEVVPNMNLWPLFHNGVAAGLRIAPNALDIDSTWIVFNKPRGTTEVPTEHAGFLMALGLNGHLNNLAVLKTFEYLIKCHEMTSVGLLLGVAACKRGTMDVAATKLMSIHIEALLPPTSIEMDMPQNIQVAALLGVGLVYEGTAHRHIAEVLLSEIGRPPGPEMENSVDRESYSLAAGLALGLVVLGKGHKLCGLGDLAISDTLHYYMVGGHRRPLTGSQKEKYKSPSYQIREGDSVNIDVTSPGATLALGMMYFDTGNRAVADWMKAPDTQYLLDFVRPDFLMLRIVARSLILWSSIVPSKDWVEGNVPATIRPYCLVVPKRNAGDCVNYETMNQAYCNILGGACMAVGLRFAGSANKAAFDTLLFYAKMFTSLSRRSIAELAGKSTIENCLNVIVIALAMVMSGTGELEVIRLCRFLRSRVGPSVSVVTYGSHLATHMALGLLFLGGGRYTLGTSPSAVAALVCAFFPKFPTHSNDNRYHLQAFRHLYVLAVEPRLVIPRDIDTTLLCYAHLTVVYLEDSEYQERTIKMKAPCILPELSKLEKVIVEDERYWTIVFQKGRNWDHLQNLLENSGCLDVKQRAGYLSYLEDPQGFRSLLAKTLTCDTAISWSVTAESICSFSSDPTVLNFARYFLEQGHVCEKSPAERELMQMLTLLTYECVTQDKLTILPIWITVTKALQSMNFSPNTYLSWQLKLLTVQVLSQTTDPTYHPPLVGADLAMSVQQRARKTLDGWEPELMPALKEYLTMTKFEADGETLKKLCTYLTLYNIPTPRKLQAAGVYKEPMNPFTVLERLRDCSISVVTADKVTRIARLNNLITY